MDLVQEALHKYNLDSYFSLVGDSATGLEGDRVPLVQQTIQDVRIPSQALSQNVHTVALRPYLSHPLSIIGPPPHGALNGGVFVVSEAVSDEYAVLLPGDHNGGVYVVSQAGRDEHSVLHLYQSEPWQVSLYVLVHFLPKWFPASDLLPTIFW